MNYNLLEIPYNFDLELIVKLNQMVKNKQLCKDAIFCFYIPLYWEDGIGVLRKPNLDNRKQISRQDYLNHLRAINNAFPGTCQILIQNNLFLSIEQLNFYINAGVNKFCVGNYRQAKYIRKYIPNAEIIASITMGLDKEKLEKHPEYKEIFNGIVLPFKYTQLLDEIKVLPKDYFYIIIPNSDCSIYCTGIQHWRAPLSDDLNQIPVFCPKCAPKNCYIESSIQARDVSLFKPYIKILKLVDRSFPTNIILEEIYKYKDIYQTNTNEKNYNRYSEKIENYYQWLGEELKYINE